MTKKHILIPAIVSSLLIVGGCASTSDQQATQTQVEDKVEMLSELYEVHKDGRIYIFYDRGLYENFIEHGHTAYSFNRIGAGPNGETLVFGLTGEDKKKLSGIPSVEIYDGIKKPGAFYGEAMIDGRIYVFDSLEEMAAVRQHHEAAYRLTDIGAGPRGETVVYVLTSENKKQRPEALIAKYKEMN